MINANVAVGQSSVNWFRCPKGAELESPGRRFGSKSKVLNALWKVNRNND